VKKNASYWWIALVVAAAALPYLPSITGGFTLDDGPVIVSQRIARSPAYILDAFTHRYLPGAFGTCANYYRPLVTVSWQVNHWITGSGPMGFRVVNLTLHAIVCLLVVALAYRLTRSKPASVTAGILFAVLPSNSEAVAWISGRTDLLSTLFTVGSILCFLNRRLPSGALLFCCALLSKENALMLPALLGAWAWVTGARPDRSKTLAWLAALGAPLAVGLGLRSLVPGSDLLSQMGHMLSQRIICFGATYAYYLKLLFIPGVPRPVYDIYPTTLSNSALAAGAWLAPVGLALLGALLRRRSQPVSFGLLWILISLLPVSNIIPSSGPVPADRFVYTAGVGSSIILGWALVRMSGIRPAGLRTWPAIVTVLGVGYVLYSGAMAMQGSGNYYSNLSWARAVSSTGVRFAEFRLTAAEYFLDAGEPDSAAGEFEVAIRNDASKVRLADYLTLARIRRRLGEPENALEVIEAARGRFGEHPATWIEQGIVLAGQGRLEEAARSFGSAVAMDARYAEAWFKLGKACFELKRYREAVAAYEEAFKRGEPNPADRRRLEQARRLQPVK